MTSPVEQPTAKPKYSLIVCTRNAAATLQLTLSALERLHLPEDGGVELIVVDNNSTDATPVLIKDFSWPGVRVTYLLEPRRGLSNARNAGIACAIGEIIVFTDDDVIPERDWLQRMIAPIAGNRRDAVTGLITLGAHLHRDWMTPVHRLLLASREADDPRGHELVGASMAFHRRVLTKVPRFDPELGPGAIGFGDDTLFSEQLGQAGFRLGWVDDARVVHNPNPARLTRREWLTSARLRGATQAYVLHHWRHGRINYPRLTWSYHWVKLFTRRLLQLSAVSRKEGIPLWELSYVSTIATCASFISESQRPRAYSQYGLFKREQSR